MKLASTAMKYEHTGRDGYSFAVDVTNSERGGWDARVSMASHGYVTPEDAIKHLRHAAEAFLRALEEMES